MVENNKIRSNSFHGNFPIKCSSHRGSQDVGFNSKALNGYKATNVNGNHIKLNLRPVHEMIVY